MAKAVARVELHGASGADYETLHTAMEKQGFARVVQASDRKWYHLPTGEYVHGNVVGMDDALARARSAAAQSGRRSAIFVVNWDGLWNSVGLAPV